MSWTEFMGCHNSSAPPNSPSLRHNLFSISVVLFSPLRVLLGRGARCSRLHNASGGLSVTGLASSPWRFRWLDRVLNVSPRAHAEKTAREQRKRKGSLETRGPTVGFYAASRLQRFTLMFGGFGRKKCFLMCDAGLGGGGGWHSWVFGGARGGSTKAYIIMCCLINSHGITPLWFEDSKFRLHVPLKRLYHHIQLSHGSVINRKNHSLVFGK